MSDALRAKVGRAAAVSALVAGGLVVTVAAAPAASAAPCQQGTPTTVVSRSWCPPPCYPVSYRVKKWYGWRTVRACVR